MEVHYPSDLTARLLNYESISSRVWEAIWVIILIPEETKRSSFAQNSFAKAVFAKSGFSVTHLPSEEEASLNIVFKERWIKRVVTL